MEDEEMFICEKIVFFVVSWLSSVGARFPFALRSLLTVLLPRVLLTSRDGPIPQRLFEMTDERRLVTIVRPLLPRRVGRSIHRLFIVQCS